MVVATRSRAFDERRMRLRVPMLSLLIGAVAAATVLTDTWIYLLYAIPGCLFVALAIARPRAAIVVWLLAAPVADAYGTIHLPGPDITFSRTAMVLVALVLLVRMRLTGQRLAIGAVELVMVALVAVSVIDLVLRSGNITSNALQIFDVYVTPVLAFFVARQLFADRKGPRAVASTLVVVGCYLALHGALQQVVPSFGAANTHAATSREGGERTNESHLAEGRSVGPFANAVEYGSVSAIAFLAALLVWSISRPASWLWLVPALIGTVAAIVLSATRSVWLGAYLGVCTVAVLNRERWRSFLLLLGAGTIAAGALLVAAPAGDDSWLAARMYSTETIAARTVMYRLAAQLVVSKPIFGYGRGAASRVAARTLLHDLPDSDAEWAPGQFHNTFVTVLVEWGLVGLLLYGAIFVLFGAASIELWRLARGPGYPSWFAAFFLGATVVTLVQGLLVDLPAFQYLNNSYFLLAGVVYGQLDRLRVQPVDGVPPTFAAVG